MPSMPEITRIGILSDTHMPGSLGTLWPEVGAVFADASVELILHAGDICHPEVLDQLEEWAPVLAARGNNDFGLQDPRVEEVQHLSVHGCRIAMTHDMEPEDEPIEVLRRRYLRGTDVDVMITGHTHFERLDWRDGVLQLNAGSAVHPHLWSTRPGTVGILEVGPGTLTARIVRLGVREGLRNPGMEYRFDGTAVQQLG
jgi:putative phosphoesterase